MTPWKPDAESEEDSEYDGAFSYASETHAFAIGFSVGLSSVVALPRVKRFTYYLVGLDGDLSRSKAMKEAKKESWYALGGMILGMILGVGMQLVTLYVGIESLV